MGVLDECGVEMIGAKRDVINKAEDRELFRAAMTKIGLDLPKSRRVKTLDEARDALDELGLPCVCRASYTLGGAGGGIAYNRDEFEALVSAGLKMSPAGEVMLDESILGWKEYEMEVMRDRNDNVVIVCCIENFDPMGVHTGDSITVAPAQTLTDKEYQRMRDATIAVMREIGVETGGSNVQFAVDPDTGRMTVIEMNPRVSRSSALASKATGFPIAKIAAKLAVGYTLDELPNDITRETKACFEPSIDYVVTKIPRWTFEKFPEADDTLTIQMKSVGETMAIGRTFKESFQKALRGTETGHFGLGGGKKDLWDGPDRPTEAAIVAGLATPTERRVSFLRYAFKSGMSLERVHDLTNIDPWFLDQIQHLTEIEAEIRGTTLAGVSERDLRRFKRAGFGDLQLACWWDASESAVRARRKELGVEAVFKQVDTCAAEFAAVTPYYYSTYETEDESPGAPPSGDGEAGRGSPSPLGVASPLKRVMILGGGPNRIGQGIEFDYCCCQAAYALEELGVESVMVNSNPETVSTDYDTSDLLFFEPLTTEDVLNVVDRLKPDGVIVQFGGQTPLNLARGLEAAGVPIIGTSPEMIDAAEDRDRFAAILESAGLRQPPHGTATDAAGARRIAGRVGYPVLVRPSYVLGGRAMEICYDGESLSKYMAEAVDASPDRPVLIDRFLEDAIEVDVDCVADFGLGEGGGTAVVAGVMEHIEEAGVHSGDSACCLPPHSLPGAVVAEIEAATVKLAKALNVCGLMNVQFAVKRETPRAATVRESAPSADDEGSAGGDGTGRDQSRLPDGRGSDDFTVYVLEVNPRASRTAPFVSKATGVPWAKVAAKAMAGVSLEAQGVTDAPVPPHYSVKESVFPFSKFRGVDIVLGPEMRSTGEVMGIADAFPGAFAKSQIAAGNPLPAGGANAGGKTAGGAIFISMAEGRKAALIEPAKRLRAMGYEILATSGTAAALSAGGVDGVEVVRKVQEGRPNLIDHMANGRVGFIFNTPSGKGARTDEGKIRAASVAYGVPCVTTVPGCVAVVDALEARAADPAPRVTSLQEWHAGGAS